MIRFVVVLVCLAGLIASASPEVDEARKLFNRTEYEAAVKALQALPQKDAAAYELMGRSYYLMGDYKKATETLEKAVAADPANSEYHLWLGRAYGRRAETSSPFTAPGYASKARQHFEKSVELDPKRLEAINDLFAYYLEAPGFLGGGFDKAAALADRIAQLDPIEAHYAQYRLAEKRKDFGKAEQQLRRAAEMAPNQVGRILDLAKFLARQGRVQESEQAFQKAEKIAPNDPKLLFERADTYIRNGRNLETARALLRKYLEAQLTPEHPPRYEAEKLLKQTGG